MTIHAIYTTKHDFGLPYMVTHLPNLEVSGLEDQLKDMTWTHVKEQLSIAQDGDPPS
jgi:hypothetical protein